MRLDILIVGYDGLCDELGDAYLIDMGVVSESLLDILHVRTATSDDDATQELVVIVGRYLEPYVLNNLLQTSLNDLYELTALYLPVCVDGVFQVVVNIVIISIGRGIFQFHALGIPLLHLEGGDIFRDIIASKGYDSQMTQDILRIDGYGSGVGTDIYQCTSRTLLCLREYAVSQCQRSEIHLCHTDASRLETHVQVLIEGLTLQNVQEVALQVVRLYAHRIELELGTHLILLYSRIENLLILIGHVTIGIHQFDDHVLSDDSLAGQILGNHILDTPYRLSANTYIDLSDFRFELSLQFLDDAGQALSGLVDIVDHTLSDERGRILLHDGQYIDTSVKILLSGDTGHLG